MSQQILVHLLPALFEPVELSGGTAVVVDVLRATSTMSFALSNGAGGVIPCGTVQDAISLRQRLGTDACLLGGERGGVKIDGFDLSNSPDDYGSDVVKGKSIGFTTTNGTKALLQASEAQEVMIGAFVNLSAVANRLSTVSGAIHIVCAGTNGAITSEDVLFAGALTARLRERDHSVEVSDASLLAYNHWQQECGQFDAAVVETALRRSQGGRNLINLAYDRDIATAAAIDVVSSVGIVGRDGVIRSEGGSH